MSRDESPINVNKCVLFGYDDKIIQVYQLNATRLNTTLDLT